MGGGRVGSTIGTLRWMDWMGIGLRPPTMMPTTTETPTHLQILHAPPGKKTNIDHPSILLNDKKRPYIINGKHKRRCCAGWTRPSCSGSSGPRIWRTSSSRTALVRYGLGVCMFMCRIDKLRALSIGRSASRLTSRLAQANTLICLPPTDPHHHHHL